MQGLAFNFNLTYSRITITDFLVATLRMQRMLRATETL